MTTYVYRLPLTDSERHELATQMRVQPDSLPPWRDVEGPELEAAAGLVELAGQQWRADEVVQTPEGVLVVCRASGRGCPWCCCLEGEHERWCRRAR